MMWGTLAFAIALRGGGPCSVDRVLGRELCGGWNEENAVKRRLRLVRPAGRGYIAAGR